MEATVFVGTSLDGFIARENGEIDWLPGFESGEDYGYQAFFDTVDFIVMGRNTYELVRTFDSWPYGSKRVIVLTRRPLEIPESLAGNVERMSAPPAEVVRTLAARGARKLYVDGGKTIQAFLAEGLIQRLIISRVPVLIGSGIPLFGSLPGDVPLRHIATRSYSTGIVQSEYEVIPAAA